MKTFIKGLTRVYLYIFITAVLAGLLVGGAGGLFGISRAVAPWVVGFGLVLWFLMKLADAAEKAESEDNQSLNLAKAMRAARQGQSNDSGPIIP